MLFWFYHSSYLTSCCSGLCELLCFQILLILQFLYQVSSFQLQQKPSLYTYDTELGNNPTTCEAQNKQKLATLTFRSHMGPLPASFYSNSRCYSKQAMGQTVFQNRLNPFAISKFYKQSIKEFNSHSNYMGVGSGFVSVSAKFTYFVTIGLQCPFAFRAGGTKACDLSSL